MGALMHMFYSLADVAARGGRVHRGTVVAARDEGREVDVRIDRTWPEPPPEPPRGLLARWFGPPARPPPPRVRTFRLARDVEWTDPHRSPVDIGIAGGIRRLSVDLEVLIVDTFQVEALEPSPRNLDSVALAFEPATRAAYAGRPTDELVHDLRDPSRRDLAVLALQASGRLTATELLDRLDGGELSVVLDTLDKLPAPDREALARQALDWLATHDARGRGDRLAVLVHRYVWYVPAMVTHPERFALAGRLLSLLDPTHEPERHEIYPVEATLQTMLDKGPLPPLDGWEGAVTTVVLHGTASDELTKRILGALPEDGRAALRRAIRDRLEGPDRKKIAGDRKRGWRRLLDGE